MVVGAFFAGFLNILLNPNVAWAGSDEPMPEPPPSYDGGPGTYSPWPYDDYDPFGGEPPQPQPPPVSDNDVLVLS